MKMGGSACLMALLLAVCAADNYATKPVRMEKPEQVSNPPVSRSVVAPLADLVVDSISLSNPVTQDDRIGASSLFNIAVKNTGKVASLECRIKLTITALSGGPAPAELSGVRTCRALAPGETFAFTWPNPSSGTWPKGSYRLTVEANSDRTFIESSAQNNIKSFDFTAAATPVFTPVVVTTGKLTATGTGAQPFTPVEVTTGKLTATGK